MNEAHKRDQKAISKYSSALMNNTKWREFFLVLSQQVARLPIEVAWVRTETNFQIAYCPPVSLLEDDYIKDPGIGGGPCYYKEIFAIRIVRKQDYKNPKTGAVSKSEKESLELLNDLEKLGQLPIEITDVHIIINGYRK